MPLLLAFWQLPAADASAATTTPVAAATTCLPVSAPVVTPPPATTPLGGVFDGVTLDSMQVTSASTIVSTGTGMKIGRRGIRIAIAVALQESSLDPTATKASYVGLFQQKADSASGLYTQYNRLDAAGATTMFFQQLLKRVPGYATDPRLDWQIGEVIQETNVGENVEQWFGVSEALTATLYAAPIITLIVPASQSLQPTHRGVTGAPGHAVAPVKAAPKVVAANAAAKAVPAKAAVKPTASVSRTPVRKPAVGTPATDAGSAAAYAVRGFGSQIPALRRAGGAFAAMDQTPGSAATTTTPVDQAASSRTTPVTTTSPTNGVLTTTGATTTGPAATTVVSATSAATAPSTTPGATTTPGTTATTTTTTTVTTTAPKTTAPKTTAPRTTAPRTTAPRTTAPRTTPPNTTPPRTTSPASTTAPRTTTTTTPSSIAPKTPPTDVSVNPDPPEPPVPTGSADPSVGPDPGPSPTVKPDTATRDTTPEATAPNSTTPIDCSPSTGGRSTAFDPGMIISDAVFYNTKAMTAADIRTFVNEKGASCTAAACLRSLRVTTPSQPADQYCAAYRGGTNEDVAAVLQRLSVACGVNPQVMLVTLQKESALLTRTDVTMANYDAMYGWHCPDSGPGGSANCDPQYAGFFNQAYGMAKQWARYRVNPQNYNYRAGQTVTILWNVAETGCGGSSVFIRNTATASLYDYTPYQPNAASLAAYPGVGDRCSSYGNRNFFFLFQKYFGTTGGGADQNVGVNGVKITIPSGPHIASGAAGKVITAPTAAMAKGLAAGLAAVGIPYVYGGGTDGGGADQGCARAGGALNSCQGIVGFDCSGLTGYVLLQSGFHIADYSGAQRAAGKSVPWAQGQPGDIIGYQGHVAIYLGIIGGTPYLLEAPDVGMFVQVRPVYYSNEGVPVDSMLHRYWG